MKRKLILKISLISVFLLIIFASTVGCTRFGEGFQTWFNFDKKTEAGANLSESQKNESDKASTVSGENKEQEQENSQDIESTQESTQETLIITPPSAESIITTFFMLLDEGRIAEAISMMDESMVPDDTTKQEYGVTLNSFEIVEIKSIEPYDKENWSEDSQTYKVSVMIVMKPHAQSGNWDVGENIRWVSLVKRGDIWKISSLATGP
jgi:hypothetical protein